MSSQHPAHQTPPRFCLPMPWHLLLWTYLLEQICAFFLSLWFQKQLRPIGHFLRQGCLLRRLIHPTKYRRRVSYRQCSLMLRAYIGETQSACTPYTLGGSACDNSNLSCICSTHEEASKMTEGLCYREDITSECLLYRSPTCVASYVCRVRCKHRHPMARGSNVQVSGIW